MYISSLWILSFAAFALATFPPEIQQMLLPHRNPPKLVSHTLQSTECKPVARDSKWFATKPRKNRIAIARRGLNNTSNDCQSSLPKSMTQEEDRKWTNAKRLAAGFPIKPPKKRKPTRAGFPRQEPSAAPTLTEGTTSLIANSDDGTTTTNLGSITIEGSGLYLHVTGGTDGSSTSPLVLSINTAAAQGGPTYITTTNGPDSAYPYFGAILDLSASEMDPTDPASYPIGPGSVNSVTFGATVLTAPGTYSYADSMLQLGQGDSDNYVVESSIFTVDSDGNLQATWVNADGSTAPLYFGIFTFTVNDSGLSYLNGPFGYGDKAAAEASVAAQSDPEVTYGIQWVNIHVTPLTT